MHTILLVEDNELNCDMLSRRLKLEGYNVETAVDGQQAVDKSRSIIPDLILMDLDLPVLNGWDATRAIKAHPETSKIPVIALTAHAFKEDQDSAFEAGCDDYDTKPIDFKRLNKKMESLLPSIPEI